MLTFSFTGVEGSMTESEVLTSGMVGKEILLVFDQSWNSLTKTLVFRAGDITRVVLNPGTTAAIPTDVLKRPFCNLYVGVYGTDADGAIVIPTVMAEGPLIRYGADPVEDETAEELPVWKNLQNQIGNTALLETAVQTDLVSAVNELHRADAFMGEGSLLKTAATDTLVGAVNELYTAQTKLGDTAALETDAKSTLVAAVNELHRADSFMGQAAALQTQHKDTLTGAVNEVHQQLVALTQNPPLPLDAAQLLVDILSQGLYQEDQYQNIAALATAFGVKVPENLGNLVAYWDFRSGSLLDRIAGLEAVATEDVVLDASGAHTSTASSYITVPLGADGASLAGNYIEIKFGAMTLVDTGTTMRLFTGNSGNQPASSGMMWTSRDCWTCKLTATTEFTDMQMFSGQTVIGRPNEDATQILWYLDEQYLGPSDPGYAPTHVSLGCSVNAAYPITVEYIKIHPQK